MNLVHDMVENIVGKGENAGYQHFLLLPQCFQNPSSSWSLKRMTKDERCNNRIQLINVQTDTFLIAQITGFVFNPLPDDNF